MQRFRGGAARVVRFLGETNDPRAPVVGIGNQFDDAARLELAQHQADRLARNAKVAGDARRAMFPRRDMAISIDWARLTFGMPASLSAA